MWNVDGDLIQVEVGANIVKAFTQKSNSGFIGRIVHREPQNEGQLLVEYTKLLREQLEKENVKLPPVHFSDSSELGLNNFKVYVGIERFHGDITKEDMFQVIGYAVKRYQIKNSTNNEVKIILNSGIEKLVKNRNYQEAQFDFARTYYWSNLINGCEVELVQSILNIGGIYLINNRIMDAELVAQKACKIVCQEYFNDPYLKYSSLMFEANILAIKENIKEAERYYYFAYESIKMTGDKQRCINSLLSLACMRYLLGLYKESAEILDAIVNIIKDADEFGKDMLIELYEFKSLISRITIEMVESKYNELQERYLSLSKNCILKTYDTLLTIVAKVGPFYVSSLLGSLNSMSIVNDYSQTNNDYSQTNNNYNQTNNSGKNIINLSKR